MVDEPLEEQHITEHISNSKTWIRLVFMILYGIVFEIGKFVGLIVALVQFLFTLFTGKPLAQLQRFGASLAEFYRQIIEFESFRTDDRPYPWAPWPQPDSGTPIADPGPDPEPAQPAEIKVAESETEAPPAKPAKPKTTRKRKKNPEQVSHDDDDAPSA